MKVFVNPQNIDILYIDARAGEDHGNALSLIQVLNIKAIELKF